MMAAAALRGRAVVVKEGVVIDSGPLTDVVVGAAHSFQAADFEALTKPSSRAVRDTDTNHRPFRRMPVISPSTHIRHRAR
jgi:hypothetical protein